MRTINRIKKTKRPFTTEHFYIIDCSNGAWQFRDRQTHFVISTANSLEGLKSCIKVILNRYKHYDLYLRAVSSMSEQAKLDKAMVRREKEHKKHGQKYNPILEELITEYYNGKESVKSELKRKVLSPIIETENRSKPPIIPPEPTRLNKKRRSRL